MEYATKEYKARIRTVETQLKTTGIDPDDLRSWLRESEYEDYKEVFNSETHSG